MRTVTIVHHRVADFDAWKAVYDGFAGTQREGGVMEHAVLCPADDPGMVVVVHTFATADAARAFFERQDLRDTMVAAGVDPDSVRVEMLDEVVAGRVLGRPAGGPYEGVTSRQYCTVHDPSMIG